MDIEATAIEGVVILRPHLYHDHRGLFYESFNEQSWDALGFCNTFVQDNVAESGYGVIRGLHYQIAPSPQANLRCGGRFAERVAHFWTVCGGLVRR